MSNLRWILLFAGFAILLLLYFSGRPRKVRRSHPGPKDGYGGDTYGQTYGDDYQSEPIGASAAQGYGNDPKMGGRHAELGVAPGAGMNPGPNPGMNKGMNKGISPDPLMETPTSNPYSRHDTIEHFDSTDFDVEDFERPGGGVAELHPESYRREYDSGYAKAADSSAPTPPTLPTSAPAPTSTLGGKLDALSARLTRRKRPNSKGADPGSANAAEEIVVLLHIVAPEGQIIDGQLLLQVFEQRRYHFGDLNIFHSLHQDQTVFSIAKMIEPGSFDVEDIASFETPGLVLILQLPGPVAADVAFEVLVSEAQELADALGCRVLDSKRSTLSRQTTQHLRESISNYMHRQKYFSKVTS